MSDQFIGVDVGGTKIAVAVLEGGELSRVARSSPTNQASQDALVEQLAAAIEGSVTAETRADRHRHAVGHRVRDRQDPRQRQHPAARHPAARSC